MTEIAMLDGPVSRALRVSPARVVTVGFAHVDAAAIVFYPRFLELFAQAFPELAPANVCFELTMGFRKPLTLGDRLTLALGAGSNEHGWQLSGRLDGDEHLTVTWKICPEEALRPDAHRSERDTFVSERFDVREWCTGTAARLHLSRYYEFVNAAIEQWFSRALDRPFRDMHDNGEGIPTVSLETTCRNLPILGDAVHIWIRPTRIGRSSVSFDSYLVRGDECLVKTTQVIVFVRLEAQGSRSAGLPSSLRGALESALAGADGS